MTKNCVICGKEFTAARYAALYCGATCRKRAQRGVRPMSVPPTGAAAEVDLDGRLAEATQVRLTEANVSGPAAVAALLLATEIDRAATPGAGLAALVKQYLATLHEAMSSAPRPESKLDQIRRARHVRRGEVPS